MTAAQMPPPPQQQQPLQAKESPPHNSNHTHPYTFKLADFTDPQVIDLIAHHQHWASAPEQNIAGEKSYAFSLAALQHPDIAFWTAWDGARLLGFAGLKVLPAGCKGGEDGRAGEIKSMHTVAAARGLGIGVLLLEHIAERARAQGLRRLYLETGSLEAFRPARRCYEKAGYEVCGAFSDYAGAGE